MINYVCFTVLGFIIGVVFTTVIVKFKALFKSKNKLKSVDKLYELCQKQKNSLLIEEKIVEQLKSILKDFSNNK